MGNEFVWESGGGLTNTGEATVFAMPDGSAPRPVHVRTGGHLACDEHAKIAVVPGMWTVTVRRRRDDLDIDVDGPRRFRYREGEWDQLPPEFLDAAIDAAVDKSYCYHCREPHFIAGLDNG